MVLERISSGITDLDPLIGGGFPKGSLILVCGNAGVGKTIFAAQFAHHGALACGENCVYVSFGEDRLTFSELMKSFGFDFEKLESEGKFCFLELATGKKVVQAESIKTILEKIYKLNAKRLVIDSFSSMAQAFDKLIDLRSVVHDVISKIIKRTGCTTLMVAEVPFGKSDIGLGVEEFVADAIIVLKRGYYDGLLLRELEILKMRGTRIERPIVPFTLHEGFKVFPPFDATVFAKPSWKYEVIPHEKDYFSTGIRDLDKIASGLFTRGGYELIEVENDVSMPIERLLCPIVCNFINQDYGVLVIPPQGISAQALIKTVEPHVNGELLERNFRVADYRVTGEELAVPLNVLALRGEFIVEDFKRFWDAATEMRKKTAKPVLSVIGYDTIEYIYGEQEVFKVLGQDMAMIRNFGDLRINVVRPTLKITNQLGALSTVHVKVCQIDGAIFIYGKKPKTPLLNIQSKTENGIREIKLMPLI